MQNAKRICDKIRPHIWLKYGRISVYQTAAYAYIVNHFVQCGQKCRCLFSNACMQFLVALCGIFAYATAAVSADNMRLKKLHIFSTCQLFSAAYMRSPKFCIMRIFRKCTETTRSECPQDTSHAAGAAELKGGGRSQNPIQYGSGSDISNFNFKLCFRL